MKDDGARQGRRRWVVAGVAVAVLVVAVGVGALVTRHESSSPSITNPSVEQAPVTTMSSLDFSDPELTERLSQAAMNGEWVAVGSARQPVYGWVNGELLRAWEQAQRDAAGGPITDPRFNFTADAPGLPVYADDHTTLIGYWVEGGGDWSGLVLLDELGS